MNDVPPITVSELRVAIGRILDVVEREFGEELRFPVDYYWHVEVEDAFALNHKLKLSSMGQISDDESTVRDFVNESPDDDNEVVLVHEIEHFAGLLKAIQYLAVHRYD